jgi:hypothetical protein
VAHPAATPPSCSTNKPTADEPVTALLVDKLVLTLHTDDLDEAGAIREFLLLHIKEQELVGTSWKNGYRTNANLVLNVGNAPCPVLLQAQPKSPKNPAFRMEWNPSKCGFDGNELLWSKLNELLPLYPDESFSGRIFADAKVTRIDVAADIRGVKLDDLEVADRRAHWSQLVFDDHGERLTYYFGKSGAKSQAKAYNKRREIKQKTGTDIGFELTRFETTCRSNHRPFKGLADLDNPLSRFRIADLTKIGWSQFGWLGSLIQDSFRKRGCHGTLKLLPPIQRSKVRAALESPTPAWWDPALLWSSWPSVLSGLLLSTGEVLPS